MAKQKWISEEEAAKLIRRHPRYLRDMVKTGRWDISYRTLNGRSYEYDENGIEKVKNKEVVLIN